MTVATLSPLELNTLLCSSEPITLLDVRLADDFDHQHLPGAKNNTVFEVAFGDRMDELAPAGPRTRICVYGSNGFSLESSEAAKKLRRLGYERIYSLHDGIEGWLSCGLPVEAGGSPEPSPPKFPEGCIEVDLEQSFLRWTGRNLLNRHHGSAALLTGSLTLDHGRLTEGDFVFDMTRLECDDLHGHELHDVLINHLKNEDFFDVENHPTARFLITEARNIAPLNSGAPNLELVGELTLLGTTRPITFKATAGITDDGRPAAQASFSIDRTRWHILYGSGKFFHRLAGHLVNDEIQIDLRIVGKA